MIVLPVLKPEAAARTFQVLLLLTLLALAGMQVTGAPLKTGAAPGGIITFELIGTLQGSQGIIESWQGDRMTWAGINMGLDFLFLTLYGVTIALACLMISRQLSNELLKKMGVYLAVGVLFAALLDIIENIALIKLLLGSPNAFLPVLAKWMAVPKFMLVLLSLLYALAGVYPALTRSKS